MRSRNIAAGYAPADQAALMLAPGDATRRLLSGDPSLKAAVLYGSGIISGDPSEDSRTSFRLDSAFHVQIPDDCALADIPEEAEHGSLFVERHSRHGVALAVKRAGKVGDCLKTAPRKVDIRLEDDLFARGPGIKPAVIPQRLQILRGINPDRALLFIRVRKGRRH